MTYGEWKINDEYSYPSISLPDISAPRGGAIYTGTTSISTSSPYPINTTLGSSSGAHIVTSAELDQLREELLTMALTVESLKAQNEDIDASIKEIRERDQQLRVRNRELELIAETLKEANRELLDEVEALEYDRDKK